MRPRILALVCLALMLALPSCRPDPESRRIVLPPSDGVEFSGPVVIWHPEDQDPDPEPGDLGYVSPADEMIQGPAPTSITEGAHHAR